jgi:hypothetical protein
MRSNLRILVAVAAALLVAPVAMAENVEEQLQQMNERMGQLEDQLGATQDELDASMDEVERQQVVMEKAGLERQGQSGLSAFYQNVEISGHLAGSWFWNFNDPGDGVLLDQAGWPVGSGNEGEEILGSANGGYGGAFYPFHPDHNSFNLDQLWFTMHKPATEESRAGFNADIVFGRTAGVLNGDEAWKCASNGDCASEINLFTAYIEYLTPWGPTIKAGKIPTWLGYEVANTTQNFNVSRGNVWTLLQPINHTGVSLEGDVGGFTYGIAAVNNSGWDNPDYNNDKHLMAKVGYGTEMFSGQIALLYGQESTTDGDSIPVGTVDLLLTADPTENFSTWFNFDYKWADQGSPDAWGVALAGRYAFTEKLGYALRGEFVAVNGGSTGIVDDPLETVLPGGITIGNSRDTDIYGVTGTLDYLVTDNLTLKWELRYDYIDSNPSSNCGNYSNTVNNVLGGEGCSNQFTQNNNDEESGLDGSDTFTRRSQVTTGLELVYQF